MPPAIQCRDLRKTYDGKVEAVRGLNLEIQAGECFGLLGPNGAGKTTTIEILEGLLEPTSGQVTILGQTWKENARELREAWEFRCRKRGCRKNSRFSKRSNCFPVSIASLARRAKCWNKCSSRRKPTPGWASCLAASVSGWRWPRRWSAIPRFFFWTSPRPGSIRKAAASSGTSFAVPASRRHGAAHHALHG